jgi:hypothetical protein
MAVTDEELRRACGINKVHYGKLKKQLEFDPAVDTDAAVQAIAAARRQGLGASLRPDELPVSAGAKAPV